MIATSIANGLAAEESFGSPRFYFLCVYIFSYMLIHVTVFR